MSTLWNLWQVEEVGSSVQKQVDGNDREATLLLH